MKFIGPIAAMFALCGCAHTVMVKPGATDADFQSDKSACEYEAMKYAGDGDPALSAIGQGFDIAMKRANLTKACMRQKGWSETNN